jgi:pimeloyl-ACP methyl ester carboxylesterase
MPLAAVDGIDLYYEDTGSGPPLLLIAGLSGNTLGWAMLLPALAQYFRVIAFDNRGAGRSSTPPGPYTTREMADDAAALLDHLGIERAHVIGLSLGGMIAQELALAHPERVDHLVLYATYARPRPAIHDPWLRNWVEACERGTTPDQLATLLLPWFLTPAFMAQPDQVEAAIGEWVADPYPAPAHGVAAQAAACLSHDTLSRLGQVAPPTLVLVGAEDIVTPVSCAQELTEGIPGARLHVLERGGHTPDVEYPEAVAEALLAFLAP